MEKLLGLKLLMYPNWLKKVNELYLLLQLFHVMSLVLIKTADAKCSASVSCQKDEQMISKLQYNV